MEFISSWSNDSAAITEADELIKAGFNAVTIEGCYKAWKLKKSMTINVLQ